MRTERGVTEMIAKRIPAAKSKGSSSRPLALNGQLQKVLALIEKHPGIRPSEINRSLDLAQSDGLRATLMRRGLVRKVNDGSATRYYATQKTSA
jgi:predicted DNA-binding transcriptional regulator